MLHSRMPPNVCTGKLDTKFLQSKEEHVIWRYTAELQGRTGSSNLSFVVQKNKIDILKVG